VSALRRVLRAYGWVTSNTGAGVNASAPAAPRSELAALPHGVDMHQGVHESTIRTLDMHYSRLLLMAVLSFVSMYVLMYAMVNRFANVYMNMNQFYMAGLMAAPMVIIELALMGAMYSDRKRNVVIVVVSLVALCMFWIFIRQQTAITNKQFLRSMIPHHASAILMCEEASIRDPEIKELCVGIVSRQQSEIDQMKAKLAELES
jgi:uncharacterized protein (DUF305 family)